MNRKKQLPGSAFSGSTETGPKTDPKKMNSSDTLTDQSDRSNELKNLITFESSHLSVWQVFHIIMAIVLRFNLSDEVWQAILDLIKLAAGPKFKYLDTSK
ncbi:Protein of unknown function [Cotesia congregata]|uniref:Uncharacterized protein n=1 Tax=Cotesia congregata TaxID=51543 RepID=A0A8J2HCA6_COTCN|nr:Protein of unknown function [Cotesia congregata]